MPATAAICTPEGLEGEGGRTIRGTARTEKKNHYGYIIPITVHQKKKKTDNKY